MDGAVDMAMDGTVDMVVDGAGDGDHPITIPLIMKTLVGGLVTGLEEIEDTVRPILLMVFHLLVDHLHRRLRHQAMDPGQHQVSSSSYSTYSFHQKYYMLNYVPSSAHCYLMELVS